MDTPPTFDQQLDTIGEAAQELIESAEAAKRVREVPAGRWASQEEWQEQLDSTFARVGSALAAVVSLVPPLR